MRLAVVVVGVALGASAVAAPRTGKVVRIEARTRGPTSTPRLCNVSTDLSGYCIGRAPDPGERISVVDASRLLATVRVTAATPLADGCNQSAVWLIQGALETGNLANPQGQTIGVIDVPIDPRSGHLVTVERSPANHPYGTDDIAALDANGDGTVDLEFVRFACDDAGAPSTSSTGNCFEVWAAGGHGLERIGQDRIRNCF